MLRKDIQFVEPGPTLAQADIDHAVQALGLGPWPADYVHYLLRFNGARPRLLPADPARTQLVRIWWPVGADAAGYGHAATLGSFHRLQDDPTEYPDLLDVHDDLGHLFPPQSLAIAGSDASNRFLLDLRPDRHGQVLYWCGLRLGDADERARDPYHNVGWVADNLVDLFNRLEYEPADAAAWDAALPPDGERDWRPW